jgi:hypothetical protein
VLFYKEHRYAVRNLGTYLRDAYTVAIKDRKAIVKKYGRLPLINPVDVQLPPPLRPPFKALGKPLDGLHYAEEEYGYISINRSNI